MGFPADRRYTTEHEWARKDGARIEVGITTYATESLGDIVYVELPKVGDKAEKGKAFGVVESTKAVSEVFAPVSGTIVEVNSPLADAPEKVGADPHGAWLVRIEGGTEYESLLDAGAYEKHCAEHAH